MPRLDLTLPADTLTDEGKQELLRDLGATLLRAEGAPNTEFFRSITWTHLHELPAEAIQTPDGVAEPHAIIDVSVPEGEPCKGRTSPRGRPRVPGGPAVQTLYVVEAVVPPRPVQLVWKNWPRGPSARS